MAPAAKLQIVRGALDEPPVGRILLLRGLVPPVAEGAAGGEVGVGTDQCPVDEESLVEFVRLDRRRRPRSPLSLGRDCLGRGDEPLHGRLVAVAAETSTLGGSVKGRCGENQESKHGKGLSEHGILLSCEHRNLIGTYPHKL
jgi:hypothetical protein